MRYFNNSFDSFDFSRTELTLVGNCESALRSGDGDDDVNNPVNIVRGTLTMGQRGVQATQAPGVPTDNGNSVWRPY